METNNAIKQAATKTVAELTLADVERVYSGKDGRCCCGCSGKYYEAGAMPARVLRTIQQATEVDTDDNYVATVIGQRLYIAYLKPSVLARR